jgi:hypothetical protein
VARREYGFLRLQRADRGFGGAAAKSFQPSTRARRQAAPPALKLF